jgi:hypothetical protein
MATTSTGQPTGQGQSSMGSERQISQAEASDRRAAGDAGGIAQTVRATTYRKLDDQKSRVSETLGSVAGAVRGMTQPLRENGQAGMAEYVDKAAQGIDRWASQLRERDIDDAVHAVQDFARRQPALFLGIAFGAGVLAARFLKSSAEDRAFKHRGQSGGAWQGSSSAMRNDFSSRDSARTGMGGSVTGPAGESPRLSSELPSAREVL